MEYKRFDTGGLSRVATSATLSIMAIIGVAWWQFHPAAKQNASSVAVAAVDAPLSSSGNDVDMHALLGVATSSTPEEISQIGSNVLGDLVGSYANAAQQGIYTPELGARIAASVAPEVDARVPYSIYDPATSVTDPDTSYKRMRAYRVDLQKSLKPLFKNKSYELGLYGSYMDTHDVAYLTALKDAAVNYRAAASDTTQVVVPKDAVQIHAGIINAMREYAATLDLMAANVGDPLTSLALLQAYNRAEDDMQKAFGALDAYYASKQP